CPNVGVSGRNSTPSLVSVGGIHPIIGVSGRNSVPTLVSVGGIVPIIVSVGGIVFHRWCQWGKE
ncbi:unnamed protein product, partial [Staurois parvus]